MRQIPALDSSRIPAPEFANCNLPVRKIGKKGKKALLELGLALQPGSESGAVERYARQRGKSAGTRAHAEEPESGGAITFKYCVVKIIRIHVLIIAHLRCAIKFLRAGFENGSAVRAVL